MISVHRTRIDWVATDRKGELFFVSGHVTGIKLARSVPAAGWPGRPLRAAGRAVAHAARAVRQPGVYSANASGGGQAQTRLRSPYAWSMRATGGQYLSGSTPVGKTARSRS